MYKRGYTMQYITAYKTVYQTVLLNGVALAGSNPYVITINKKRHPKGCLFYLAERRGFAAC